MSKELTEQWKNGTLPENWYYVHLKSNWGGIDCIIINYCNEDGVFEEYPDEDIKEVLAPVPTYGKFLEYYTGNIHWKKECKRLQGEANKLLPISEHTTSQEMMKSPKNIK